LAIPTSGEKDRSHDAEVRLLIHLLMTATAL